MRYQSQILFSMPSVRFLNMTSISVCELISVKSIWIGAYEIRKTQILLFSKKVLLCHINLFTEENKYARREPSIRANSSFLQYVSHQSVVTTELLLFNFILFFPCLVFFATGSLYTALTVLDSLCKQGWSRAHRDSPTSAS